MFSHPAEVCMDYYSHLKLSIHFAFVLFTGSLKALVHGIYPDWYITSTSDTMDKVQKMLQDSGCNRDVSLHQD